MRSRQLSTIALVLLIIGFSLFQLRHRATEFFPKPFDNNAQHEPDYWTWETASPFRPLTLDAVDQRDDPCKAFPTSQLSRVQVVLKIGSTEPSDRVNAQIASATRCISNLIVFSDRNQDLGPQSQSQSQHRAHDILADLPAVYTTNNSDFDVYHGAPIEGPDKAAPGWRLDRYKFLPMVERARAMSPGAEWSVFIEADTYVVWDNLFRLLERFDPRVPLYLGSPSPGRPTADGQTTWFAFGGTGVVLSGAAVDKVTARAVGKYGEFTQASLTERYVDAVKSDCCGDSILGWALYEAGVELSGLWPMFNPHPFHSIPFSDAYWCQPVITAHRSRPEEMLAVSKLEAKRGWTKPLLYADLFDHLRLGAFNFKPDWDNANFHGFRDDPSSAAHKTLDNCASACRENPGCFQFTYDSSGICTFVRSIRLGSKHVDSERKVRLFSGWDVDQIEQWKKGLGRKCETPVWVKPSLTRIY